MKKIISIITSALLALMYLIPTFLLGVVSAEDNENTSPTRIEFCEMSFILDYEQYSGIYLDSNRDVYSFCIENVTEDWNLYSQPGETPIKLTDPMPQGGLLDYLSEHQECCKLIDKTSLEDYEDYKNELEQMDLNTEMEYRPFDEPDVIGLEHVERFAIQYDDSGNRQIVFLSGGLSAKYDHYLKNPDEHAIALNDKMIQYEKINEPTTTSTTTTQITTSTNSTTETTTTSYTAQSTIEAPKITTSNMSVSTSTTATTENFAEDAYFALEAEIVQLPNITTYNWYNDSLSLDGLRINLWFVEENGHKQAILQNQSLSDLPDGYSYNMPRIVFDRFDTYTVPIAISTYNELLNKTGTAFIEFDVEYEYTPIITNTQATEITTSTTTTTTVTTESRITTTKEVFPVPQIKNVKEIAFVYNDFSWNTKTNDPTYIYSGFYITMSGDVYSFNVNSYESLTYRTYRSLLNENNADFSQSIPQRKMLNTLNESDELISKHKIGSIELSELNYYLALQDEIDISAPVDIVYRDEDDVLPYSETWGVRQSDNNVLFFNGGSDIYLTHTDKNANIIDEWLRNLEFESPQTTTFKNITQNDFTNWAKTDYESKTGILPVNVSLTENANGNYEITLTDEDGNILDVYTVAPSTAEGTDQAGEEVNLPQTGYSNVYKVIAGLAALMTASGAALVVKTRKETE